MTEPTITVLPPAALYAMEIWSRPHDFAARFEAEFGLGLPPLGRAIAYRGMMLLRVGPSVWHVEGGSGPLGSILGDDGALTAIGGAIARVRIAGPGWRTLLMEGGVFDAEAPAFIAGCCASTVIDHVAVRLRVESAQSCIAYVPASFCTSLVDFWHRVR